MFLRSVQALEMALLALKRQGKNPAAQSYNRCPFLSDARLSGPRCLPDAHDAVIICRGEACSIRRPGDAIHPSMAAIHPKGVVCSSVLVNIDRSELHFDGRRPLLFSLR